MARAIAPNPAIRAIPDGKEGDTVRLGVTFDESGARYDRLTYAWSGITGLDDATAASPTWTRQDVNADTELSVRVEVTAHGDGRNADNGTTDSRSDTEPATVLQVPDAVAPTGAVRRITSGGTVGQVVNANERTTIQLDAAIERDGTFDRIEYAWTLVDFREGHRGTLFEGVFNDATRAAPIVTLPSVNGNTSVYLRCVVTAYGDNGNARRGTSHSRTLTDAHFTILERPDASAPSFSIQGVTNGESNSRANLSVEPSGGRYDRITYRWSSWVHGSGGGDANDVGDDVFDDRTARTPVWTRPLVTANTVYTIRCEATVHGDDGDAERGTQAVDHADINTTVFPLPDAEAPTVTLPAVPRGDMRTRVAVVPQLAGGRYDRLEYRWFVLRTVAGSETRHPASLSNSIARNIFWARPDVSPDDQQIPFTIRLHVFAHGEGQTTRSGSRDDNDDDNDVSARVDYVNVAARTGGIGVYVTDEHGNEIEIDAMFPSAAEEA